MPVVALADVEDNKRIKQNEQIEHEGNILCWRNLSWAIFHTVCIAMFALGVVFYSTCPKEQNTTIGFILMGALSFLTFWSYFLLVIFEFFVFHEGMWIKHKKFYDKLTYANQFWVMINTIHLTLVLVVLLTMTILSPPNFDFDEDRDPDDLKVNGMAGVCQASNNCCDRFYRQVAHSAIVFLWVMIFIIFILVLWHYVVPSVKDCKRKGCCDLRKHNPYDDEDYYYYEGMGEYFFYN